MNLIEGEHNFWNMRWNNPILNDEYLRGLAIYDHLNECLILANEIKRVKNYKPVAEGEENKALEEKLYNRLKLGHSYIFCHLLKSAV